MALLKGEVRGSSPVVIYEVMKVNNITPWDSLMVKYSFSKNWECKGSIPFLMTKKYWKKFGKLKKCSYICNEFLIKVFDIFEIEKWVSAEVGESGQTVNLLPYGWVGSNPTWPTITLLSISYLES